jgi:hypothetical protein
MWFVSLLTVFVALNISTNRPETEPADQEIIKRQTRPATVVEATTTVVVEPEPDYNLEAEYIAKTVWGEARGCTVAEQEQVIWCILNRVDSDIQYFPDDIISVVTQPNQFHGYSPEHPVTEEHYTLALDVLERWEAEKRGDAVQRNLGKEYLYFHGDGKHNYFRENF